PFSTLSLHDALPIYWSYHDYADVTSGQYAQSLAFTKALYNHYATAGKPQPQAWVTESGIVLTDRDASYNGQAITCANGEADDARSEEHTSELQSPYE